MQDYMCICKIDGTPAFYEGEKNSRMQLLCICHKLHWKKIKFALLRSILAIVRRFQGKHKTSKIMIIGFNLMPTHDTIGQQSPKSGLRPDPACEGFQSGLQAFLELFCILTILCK